MPEVTGVGADNYIRTVNGKQVPKAEAEKAQNDGKTETVNFPKAEKDNSTIQGAELESAPKNPETDQATQQAHSDANQKAIADIAYQRLQSYKYLATTPGATEGQKEDYEKALAEFNEKYPDYKPEETPKSAETPKPQETPKPKETTEPMKFGKVGDTLETKYYDLDRYENGRTLYSSHVPVERETVKSKKDTRKNIKDNASFTDVNGVLGKKGESIKGRENLKAARETVEDKRDEAADKLKSLSEQYKAKQDEYWKLRNEKGASDPAVKKAEEEMKKLGKEMAGAVETTQNTSEAYEQVNRAYKTSKGNGTRRMARKERDIVKSRNKIADRSHVYATKDQQNDAVSTDNNLKGHVGHLDKRGTYILQDMRTLAARKLEKAGIKLNDKGTDILPNQKLTDAQQDILQEWGDILKIQLPAPGDDAATIEAKTRATQKALMTLAGADNTIDPTEKKAMVDELKEINPARYKGLHTRGLRTEINKLFNTYGLENRQRSRYKLMDAGKAAALSTPAALSAGASKYFESVRAHAHALAKATATATATAHIDAIDFCIEAVAKAIAHAEASVPGFSFSTLDPETQEEIIHQVAGQFDEQTIEVVATATKNVHIDGKTVTKTESAIAEKPADAYASTGHNLGGALATAGAVVLTNAIVGYLTSKGNEHGVGTDAKEYKDAQFIRMHKGVAAKGEAQQIINLRDQLAKKMVASGMSETDAAAQADKEVVNLYKQSEGVQNGVMKMEELTGVRVALADIVDKWTPAEGPSEPPTEPPTIGPTAAPTVAPSPTPTDTPSPAPAKDVHQHLPNIYIKSNKYAGTFQLAQIAYGQNDGRIVNAIKKEILELNPQLKNHAPGPGERYYLPEEIAINGKTYKLRTDLSDIEIDTDNDGDKEKYKEVSLNGRRGGKGRPNADSTDGWWAKGKVHTNDNETHYRTKAEAEEAE